MSENESQPPRFYDDTRWRVLSEAVWVVLAMIVVVVLIVGNMLSTAGASLHLFRLISRHVLTLLLVVPVSILIVANGGLDLSVGAVAGLAMGVIVQLAGQGVSMVVGALAGLALALLVGLINGVLVGVVRINGALVTFGMGALLVAVFAGQSMVAVPDALQTFGQGVVPVLMWIISLMVLAVVILLLHVTPLRRHASDDKSLSWPLRAVYAGGPYVASSLMAGLLGIVLLGQLGAAVPGAGTVIQIEVLLAVVIGGTPFGQGYGYAVGGVAGVLIASLLNTLMNLVQAQSGSSPVFWRGLLLVVGMLLAHLYAFGVQWLFGRRAPAPAPES